MVMQIAASIGILIQIRQPEAGLQLPADLFFQRVRKLDSGVGAQAFRIQLFILQRIERQRIFDRRFIFVKYIIRTDIIPAQQHAAFFEDAEALLKNRFHLFNIAVGNRMENEIKRLTCSLYLTIILSSFTKAPCSTSFF